MQFTYLLGAGASFEKLPLVNNFSDRLSDFCTLLNKIEFYDTTIHGINIGKGEGRQVLTDDINWLLEAISNHISVDTLARKLYLKGEDVKLKKLKGILDVFFFIEQILKGYDKRYDNFFATILGLNNGEIELPKEINMVSWNYDFQIELSLASYLDITKISILEDYLQIMPRKKIVSHDPSKFSIYKLNGTAGGITFEQKKFRRFDFNPLEITTTITEEKKVILFEDMLKHYLYSTMYSNPDVNRTSSILFSWEKDPIPIEVRENCAKALAETKYLVIIGYSFPTFNRDSDKFLFNHMRNLKTIYIQSPKDTIDSVVVRLKSLLGFHEDIEIEPIDSVDEFYIPFEYNG